MNPFSSYLPVDFGWPNAIAIALIFGLWGFYSSLLGTFGKGSLNTQLHVVRLRWLQMHQGIDREHRVFDAILLGHISSSISYFGSATLIVLAGLVGTMANVNRIYILTRDLAFLDTKMTSDLFTLYFALLTLILALSFFAFTDALRKHLAKKGFDPTMGARPMQRLIQDTIRRALADELLFGRLVEGGRLTVDIDDKGEVLLDIQPPRRSDKPRTETTPA